MPEPSTPKEQDLVIELKDPLLAAFLAWLIPGLGHFYQGRTAKAIIFFVCIMSTFCYGVYLGGNRELGWGRVVYVSWHPKDRRYYYFLQVGAGLPSLPALVQASRVRNGKRPLMNGVMAPPARDAGEGRPTADILHRQLHRFFELGTLYTAVAGLLNILAIWDAWGGPVFMEEEEDKDGSDDKDGSKDNSNADS